MQRANTNPFKLFVSICIIASLVIVCALQAGVAATVKKPTIAPVTPKVILPAGTVADSNGMKFVWKEAYEMPGDLGNVLRFAVSFKNEGKKDVDMMDYWVKLSTLKGSSFSVQLMPSDRNRTRISVGETIVLSYYAVVPAELGWNNLQVQIVRWDFSNKLFQRSIGLIKKAGPIANSVLPVNTTGKLLSQGVPLNLSLKKLNISTNDAGERIAQIEVVIENKGIRAVELPSFGYYLRSNEGLFFPLDGASNDKGPANPRSPRTFSLLSTIPEELNEKQLQLWVTQVVTSSSSSSLASLSVPVMTMMCPLPSTSMSSSIGLTSIGQAAMWKWNLQPLRMTVAKYTFTTSDETVTPQVTWTMEQRGTVDVPVPQYSYVLQTASGVQYPLTVAPVIDNQDSIWLPQTVRDYKGKISVPSGASMTNAQLWVFSGPARDAKGVANKPIAMFALPPITEEVAAPVTKVINGETWSYASNGKATLKIVGFSRLPWDETDELVLRVLVTNTDTKPISLPTFTPQIWLDDALKLDAKWVNPQGIATISAGASGTVMVLTKLPYTSNFQNVQLRLLDKSSEIVRMDAASKADVMKQLSANETMSINQAGKRVDLQYKNAIRFESDSGTSVLVAWLNLTNKESRYVTPGKFFGYLRNVNGNLYPASISNVPVSGGKLAPFSDALLTISASIPKGIDVNTLQLWIGEGVADDKAATSDQTPDAWVNDFAWSIHDTTFPSKSVQSMNAYPYTISFNELHPLFIESEMTLQLDYQLTRNSDAAYSNEDSKVIIEYATEAGKSIWSDELDLDRSGATVTDGAFALGVHSLTIHKPYSMMSESINYGKSIRLNVYYKVKGAKRLLASRPILWVTGNLTE